jgi:hypothetical protein
LKRSGSSSTSRPPALQLQQQLQPLAACLLLEQLHHLGHMLLQAHRLRCQLQVAGFDAGNVEDVADQLEQAARRVRGDLDRQAVEHSLLGLAQGQLEHAQHGIERCAYLVAHGGKEVGLGLVGAVGIVLGRLQLHLQVLALGDIDPAGDHPAWPSRRPR